MGVTKNNGLLSLLIFLVCFTQLCLGQRALSLRLQDAQCSETQLCPEGCCSSAGYCGYGPDYCGKGCLSTCNRKSECRHSSWDSDDFSEGDKCPLNVCCSKHGFCGYTEEFCDEEVKRPSCSQDKAVKRVMGYYESWAPSQRGRCYSLEPEEIPFGQYTDIIFSFATINPSTFKISAGGYQTEYMMQRMRAIKTIQPDVRLWVAIGGWAFNDPGPTQTTFSDLAASTSSTKAFIDSLVSMMKSYGFDGVDIDWEYPVAEDRSGRPEDYKNVVTFMKALRTRMKSMDKLTSMAIPASYWYLQHFDIAALESQVDWFNIMSYDVHGSWDIDNEWTGPWVNSHTNMTEIQMALDLLWRNNISPTKVTMGMSFYSRSFTLTDPSCKTLGCRVASGGNPGECSDTAGVLLHPEIADIVKKNSLSPTLHREGAVKTVAWGNQWVSFDDAATWRLKANIARGQCIEGFMVWALSQDDKSGTNIKALNQALGRKVPQMPDFEYTDPPPPEPVPALAPKLCRWSSCFEGCPPGFKSVQRDGHKEIMMDTTVCPKQLDSNGFSRLCCPASNKLPTCTWRGHNNSSRCKPGCNVGEVEVGSVKTGCKSGYQSACCTKGDVVDAYGQCFWSDCTDEPEKICGNRYIMSSTIGWSGQGRCKGSQSRAFCCPDNPPEEFTNCDWIPKRDDLGGNLENICEGSCPTGTLRLALSAGFHKVPDRDVPCLGNNAFCCVDPEPIDVRDPDDPNDEYGGIQAKEFKMLLDKYVQAPACPAEILEPPIYDMFVDGSQKRSLVQEAAENDRLVGRQSSRECTLDNWMQLVHYATLMIKLGDVAFGGMRLLWDSIFAERFGEGVDSSTIIRFLSDYTSIQARYQIEYILLNPYEAGGGMESYRSAGSQLCEIRQTGESLTKRGPQSVSPWTKRTLWSMKNDVSGVPEARTAILGIAEGDLTLHYARWTWQWGETTSSERGPILELAYWIGRTVGEDTIGQVRYSPYRDMRDGTGRDRWVVFHFHLTARPRQWLTTEGRHTYIGVPGFRVFHAREINIDQDNGAAWRVDGNTNLAHTARSGWYCPDNGGLWWVGMPGSPIDPGNPTGEVTLPGALQTWGESLWRDGYFSTPGLRLIVEPPDNYPPGEEVDPEFPGYLVRPPSGWTSVLGPTLSPYDINFLLENGEYQFAPEPPPEDQT